MTGEKRLDLLLGVHDFVADRQAPREVDHERARRKCRLGDMSMYETAGPVTGQGADETTGTHDGRVEQYLLHSAYVSFIPIGQGRRVGIV